MRHVLAVLGPKTMAVIPPSCMAVIAGPQPFSGLKIPVYQPTLESSAAAASFPNSLGNAAPGSCPPTARSLIP